MVDDRSGQPDRLSPTGYSKSDYDRSWSSQEWKSGGCGARSIRRNLRKFLGICGATKLTLIVRDASSRRKCAFRKVRRDDS